MFTSTSFSNEAYTAFDTSLFRDAICTDCRILQRRMRGDRKFPTTVSLTCMSLFSPHPHVYSLGSPSGFVGITCGHRRGERPYADRWCLTFVDKDVLPSGPSCVQVCFPTLQLVELERMNRSSTTIQLQCDEESASCDCISNLRTAIRSLQMLPSGLKLH